MEEEGSFAHHGNIKRELLLAAGIGYRRIRMQHEFDRRLKECPEIFFTMKKFCSAREENLPKLQSHDMWSQPQCQIDVVNDRNNAAPRFTIKALQKRQCPVLVTNVQRGSRFVENHYG